jgi:hypothetical protein
VAADESARVRLRREVALLQRIREPEVARLVDAEIDQAEAFVVTELIDGTPLDQLIADDGPLSLDAVADLGMDLDGAISAVHDHGVVHRDIKPGNIMVRRDGSPVIIDFGIAQEPAASRLTGTGFVAGTPGFVSPELLRGEDPTPQSDRWAVAAVLLYAATGRAPFAAGTVEATLNRVLEGDPDTEGLPQDVAGVFRAALAPDQQERLPLAELVEALDNVSQGKEILPPTRVSPADQTAVLVDGPGAPPPVYPPRRVGQNGADDADPPVPPPDRTAVLGGGASDYPAPDRTAVLGDTEYPYPAPDRTSVFPEGPAFPPPPVYPQVTGPEGTVGAPPGYAAPYPSGGWPDHTAFPYAPVPEPPPRHYPLVMLGLWAAASAVGTLWPLPVAVVVTVALIGARAVWKGRQSVLARRRKRGNRPSDGARTAVGSLWYLVRSLFGFLPAGLFAWGVGLGGYFLATDVVEVTAPNGLVGGAFLALAALIAWWGPSSEETRDGLRTLVGWTVPSRIARALVVVVALVGAVVVIVQWTQRVAAL